MNRILSHLAKVASDASYHEEEENPESLHTSPSPIPLTDPYSILRTSVNQLTLSRN